MIKHQLSLEPSPAAQTILESGRGRALRITISHSQDSVQTVAFYDYDGLLLASYKVHPTQSPCSISFANRDAFDFPNGLKVFTGNCSVNLLLIY